MFTVLQINIIDSIFHILVLTMTGNSYTSWNTSKNTDKTNYSWSDIYQRWYFPRAVFPSSGNVFFYRIFYLMSVDISRAYTRPCCILNPVNNPQGLYALCVIVQHLPSFTDRAYRFSVIQLEFSSIMFLHREPDSLNAILRRIIKVSCVHT